MKERCTNPRAKRYALYGGRGIRVCDRWLDFVNFLADMGECPDTRLSSLDRIDPDGHYTPDNCRWADPVIQGRNRRNVKLTMEAAEQIRWLVQHTRQSKASIGRSFNVSDTTVRNIVNGFIWRNPDCA